MINFAEIYKISILMKKILVCLLVIMPSIMFAQLKGFSNLDFLKLKPIAMSAKTSSELYLMGGDAKTLTPFLMNDAFKQYCDTLSEKPNPYVVYKDAISSIYTEWDKASGNYKPVFVSNEKGSPILCDYKNASKALIFHTLAYSSTFNVLKLKERDRALMMVTDVLIPTMSEAAKKIPAAIKYYGVAIAYGSKDFSEKNEFSKSDWLLMVVPTNLAKDYSDGYITEDELLEKSDIYLSPRDYYSMIKKIKLEIK